MTQAGEEFLHKEGYQNAEWILLDFGNCVAHIFTEEARRFYGLLRLEAEKHTAKLLLLIRRLNNEVKSKYIDRKTPK